MLRKSPSQNQTVLLDQNQTKDLTNSLKKRRIEIFFRGRYVNVGNNINMKEKINKFMNRQQNKLNNSKRVKGLQPVTGKNLAADSAPHPLTEIKIR